MENSKIIKENQKAIGFIDIVIPDPNNPGQNRVSIRGTGFIVSKDGSIATNAHVYLEIPESERKFLGFNIISGTDKNNITSYSRYQLELIKIDEVNDIAILRLKIEKEMPLETVRNIGTIKSVEDGEEVLIVGHPLATELMMMGFGITLTANQCIVSAIKRRGIDGSFDFFLVDTHINAGSSGSPVFSKNTGMLIGIASGKIAQNIMLQDEKKTKFQIPANIGICRPVDYLSELINKK